MKQLFIYKMAKGPLQWMYRWMEGEFEICVLLRLWIICLLRTNYN